MFPNPHQVIKQVVADRSFWMKIFDDLNAYQYIFTLGTERYQSPEFVGFLLIKVSNEQD
ncbi:hypothetical protein [Phormidesmis priestleyi]